MNYDFVSIDPRPSSVRKNFPVPKKLTDDDLILISHKFKDGEYATAAITLKELRNYILGGI